MSAEITRECPSPVLAWEQVNEVLIECNGQAGAAGGALGSALSTGMPLGGGSGGRAGGRLGAKLFTKVTGADRTVAVPWTSESHAALRGALTQVVHDEPADGHGADVRGTVVGLLGVGWMNMSAAIVQAVWHPDRVELTAHALEGLIKQRSAIKALDVVEEALAPHRR